MNNYFQSVPRWYEIAAGIVMALFSALLIILTTFIVYKRILFGSMDTGVQIFILILLAIGYFCGLMSYRLILAPESRRQKGLFSPYALRLGGLLFASVPIIMILTKSFFIIEIISSLSASVACFALAKYRENYNHTNGKGTD